MPPVHIVLPIVLDLSAVAVEIFGADVSNNNPYAIDLNGVNLSADDLSGALWYMQTADGTDPDDVSCWPYNEGNSAPLDKDGAAVVTGSWDSSGSFVENANEVLDDYVLCSGSAFQTDYSSLPQSTYGVTNPMYKFSSFYQAMLGRIAFDVFGHPLAQAGIENDTALVQSMKDHNLGHQLLEAINDLAENDVKLVFNQVIESDITRFNSMADVPRDLSGAVIGNNPQSIQFKAGDTVTFEVTMASSPVVRGNSKAVTSGSAVASDSSDLGNPVSGVNGENTVSKTYALTVTLS